MKKSNLPTISFSTFDEEKVKQAFGLRHNWKDQMLLETWQQQATNVVIDDFSAKVLMDIHHKAKLYGRNLNEQELRDKIIAPLLYLVNFDDYDLAISAFSERNLRIVFQETIIEGKVDWMVASGQFRPHCPFFFIHEYKKEKESSNDPLGQVLVAMQVATLLNQETPKPSLFQPKPKSYGDIPICGCYVVGKFWYFVQLKGQEYTISKAWNSGEKEDIKEIFKWLVAQKNRIKALVSERNK